MQPTSAIQQLMQTFPALNWSSPSGGLSGGEEFLFMQTSRVDTVALPAVPTLFDDECAYLLVPAICELPMVPAPLPRLAPELCSGLRLHLPDDEFSDDEWGALARDYAREAGEARSAAKHLRRLGELRSGSLFATRPRVDFSSSWKLIENFVPWRGVSVWYGAWDEFKTTVITDIAAHVAGGANWQGRAVMPCPVLYYALEAEGGVRTRLHALEDRLRKQTTAWGNEMLPVKILGSIPGDYMNGNARAWREEINQIQNDFMAVARGREIESGLVFDGQHYLDNAPLIIVDTLSKAMKGEDENGHKAGAFIHACETLVKPLPTEEWSDEDEAADEWADDEQNDEWFASVTRPVASHVIVVAHQTKTGDDYAGHRSIASDTGSLYHVTRFGRSGQQKRSMAGRVTPIRTKDMALPAPVPFEVEIVETRAGVHNEHMTAAILKGRAAEVSEKLRPITEALRAAGAEVLTAAELNSCLDTVATNRTTRARYRKELEDAGVLEAIEDAASAVTSYRFHDAQ